MPHLPVPDMLKGWHREEHRCRSQVGSRKREILWMNFKPYGQLQIEVEDYGR